MAERFANDAQTTLDGAIDDSQTTLNVVDASAFPTGGNFRIRVEDEYMLVTGVNAEEFTVERNAEGSIAAAHADTSTVTHVLTAGGLDSRTSLLLEPLRIEDREGYYLLEVYDEDFGTDDPDQFARRLTFWMSSRSPGGSNAAFQYEQSNVAFGSQQRYLIQRSDGSTAIEYLPEAGFLNFSDAIGDLAVQIDPFGRVVTFYREFQVPFADFDADNQLFSLDGWMDLKEQPSAPAAPPADTARLYTEDLGGKTALYVRFPTGTPVKIAEEP